MKKIDRTIIKIPHDSGIFDNTLPSGDYVLELTKMIDPEEDRYTEKEIKSMFKFSNENPEFINDVITFLSGVYQAMYAATTGNIYRGGVDKSDPFSMGYNSIIDIRDKWSNEANDDKTYE